MTHCLDAETLAALADGKLPRREIAPVMVHLDTCSACRRTLAATNALMPREESPRVWWLAAAAILAIAVLSVVLLRRGAQDTDMQRLVKLTPARIVEPRLTGGFAWSAYAGPMRASETATDPKRLKLAGAAGEILDRGKDEHAAGVALVLIERPLDAIARLRTAAQQTPNDAHVWSDLAAAQYAAAARLGRPSLYPEALASADHALRLDGNLAEARFNRALILERIGLAQAARDAWQRYLEIDPSSPWAAEARQHLSTAGESRFNEDQPRLERAALTNDTATVAILVDRYRQQTRTFGEVEYLGRWAEGNADALTIARALGEALRQKSGESLLAEAVHAIDTADAPRRTIIAQAHAIYRRGRIAYSKHSPAEAEQDLRRAAALFADDPMALVARYYAANTLVDRNETAAARAELEPLLREIPPRYAALGAQVRWELALCLMNEDDWSGALPLITEATETFRRLGESANLGFTETMLADALVTTGRPDDAWAARIRSFETLSAGGQNDRLAASISAAEQMELRSGRQDVARSLLQIEKAAQQGNDLLLAKTLVRETVLNAELGDDNAASTSAREANAVASRIKDDAIRKRALADVQFAEGAVAARSDPRRAAELLGGAIDFYERIDAPLLLPESYLLRARAMQQLGDAAAARRDLDKGITVVERHGLSGTVILDAGVSLYRDAIGLALARDDIAAAFGYAERSFGGKGTLAELQQRLAGSGAAVLELVTTPSEVIAFCVTADDVDVQRHRLVDVNDTSALYDILIRPFAPQLARSRSLIIVADATLASIPFAALGNLIDQLPIALAANASALRRDETSDAPHSILAVGLATGENVALPGADEELANVTRLYPRSREITDVSLESFVDAARGADVIHIAGHTHADRADEAVLQFGSNERVSWRRLAGASFPSRPVVILAACETLRAPQTPGLRALSLGAAALAAGAGDVIGTLTPIADNEARVFFQRVHRNLASGAGAAEALRRAQIESREQGNAWRSVTLMTNRIPRT